MNGQKRNKVLLKIGSYIMSFLIFFGVVAFVVTCTFMVAFSGISMPEEDIRVFAPAAFACVIVLTVLFWGIDAIRRIVTVDRPATEIKKTLNKLMEGDFKARASVPREINLENRFHDIADSINLLAEELSGVEMLRTDFIANVSHELKTPLAVMQNYGTMLQQPGLSEEQRMEYAKAITETSRRLANLITNILKLNKLENQQIFPAAEEYDLGEQLCECLLQFEDAWEQKSIEIKTDLEDGVMIRSDAELLQLVWSNLISNAVKFTEPGGKISVCLKTAQEQVIVRIADTGCGMKPEVGAHIFEKFYQGDTSHATQGNGLGLALVKRVVDILRGEIGVESVYGQGTVFTVKFRGR